MKILVLVKMVVCALSFCAAHVWAGPIEEVAEIDGAVDR